MQSQGIKEMHTKYAVQFVGKLSEAFRYLNIKRNNDEMDVIISKEWKRKKTGLLMEVLKMEAENDGKAEIEEKDEMGE